MLGTRHRFLLVIGTTVSLFLAPTAVNAHADEAKAPGETVSHSASVSARNARATAADYWTTQRMASAIPVETTELAEEAAERAASGNAPGPDAPQAPAGAPTTGSEPAAPTTGDSLHRAAVTATQVVGKVFFTASDGLDYVCSASAVNSTGKNMVFTAGHCVHGGPGESWASNWQFVPYYDHGSRPYGTWSAETLVAFNGWIENGNFGYDLGIVITYPNSSGTELVDAVGGLGVQWNYEKARAMTAMGYPASGQFDGEWQYFCQATTSQRSSGVPDQIKMPCNMTGGSSGGPWIYGKDDSVYYSGYVNGVNSNVEDRDAPTEMRSPYFATWVGDAFNEYSDN
ncbi:serine protease [Streptomyces sp. Ru87]|uniref:trypsin-like serine peptidase n=1 Tax=Streptomyces sp. Ru87 TaxID=2044307 RepID=UPI000BF8F388|nr:hypothetical protein [Streptomyces sp. Ru87]PGH47565.1 hypothetical protein CRI70_27855 [Streptomyces sp. Ru87]